jgi:non-specific serine/threonine protein kinase
MAGSRSIRFADYELHPEQRRLERGGDTIALGSRAFDLLLVLAEHAGNTVSKNELLARVWAGQVVTENNLAVQIAALRKALGSNMVVSVTGRGYCLAAPASPLPTAPPDPKVRADDAPAASSVKLFGREHECHRLGREMTQPGCITLIGPAGVGKSSLALWAFEEWRHRSALLTASDASGQSVAWVDLAALAAETELLPAICRAAGLESSDDANDALLRRLGALPALLVLDNAERLHAGVGRLASMLTDSATGLCVLVTSQLPLGIARERVERIAPLSLIPDWSDGQAIESAAVAMFLDRVHAADPRYRIDRQMLSHARELCVALDGLPLALEMAAARVPLVGIEAVHAALDERFGMLRQSRRTGPAHHRSLTAALDWSYELLASEEKRFFCLLGVFTAGFSADLALAVADLAEDRWNGIDRLESLVRRSLVTSDHMVRPRHRLLETMRNFALARLSQQGDEQATRSRLLHALVKLFSEAESDPRDDAARKRRVRALDEMGNVREALCWGRTHEPAAAVELAVRCSSVATFSPWGREATDWLAECEPLLASLADQRLVASWWRHFAALMLFRGSPRAGEAARRAVALCRAAGDPFGLFWSLIAALRAGPEMGEETDSMVEEMLGLERQHPEWIANARVVATGTVAIVCARRRDFEGELAHRLVELDLATRAGMAGGRGAAEVDLGKVLCRLGREDEALQRIDDYIGRESDRQSVLLVHAQVVKVQALIQRHRTGEALAVARIALAGCRRHGMSEMDPWMAALALHSGRPRAAALLIGFAQRTAGSHMAALTLHAEGQFARMQSELLQLLDEETCLELAARGRHLDMDAADALLLGPNAEAHG